MHPDPNPLLSPSLIRDAESGCGLRVRKRWAREPALRIPFGPARLRDALIDQLREAHRRGPSIDPHALAPPATLSPEEQRVFREAAERYAVLFADAPAEVWDLPTDTPTHLRRRGIDLLNPMDLTLRGADGVREVRLLTFGGDVLVPDPLTDGRVRMSILRVAVLDGADTPLRVSIADVLNVDLRSVTCVPEDVLPDLGTWLDDAIVHIDSRNAQPRRGTECVQCQFVHTCPAHPLRAGGRMQRHDYLPPVIGFTPTSYDAWTRCPHQFKLARLLRLPASDVGASPDEGILVHRILEAIHLAGDCHDDDVVGSVLAGSGLDADQRTRGFIERHRQRCPSPAPALGHEYSEARFHRLPLPNFVAAARYDAIWIHDGRLDVRDYKTGAARLERVGDDPRARLQAWVLAPLAASLDLELAIRYEMLAPEHDEDPEPFVPDDADLEAITEELRTAAAAVAADEFPPTDDPVVCGFCRYRSICSASAAPGVPLWPQVAPETA